MAPDLRIGFVGAGDMARAHLGAARRFGAEPVSVHDVNADKAQRFADAAGCDVAETDLDAVLDAGLDAVVVAIPPAFREDVIRRVTQRGLHLLLEKPPTLDLEEGRRCLAMIEQAGVICSVGFQMRYTGLHETLRTMIDHRPIHLGHSALMLDRYLTFAQAPWFLQNRMSGGAIGEQAIHLIDLFRFVLADERGREPLGVRAHALGVKNMAPDRDDLDADNAVALTWQLDTGAFLTHSNHCGTDGCGPRRYEFDLEVVGPDLRLAANLTTHRITGMDRGEAVDVVAPEENTQGFGITEAWLRAVATGDRSLIRCDYRRALESWAIAEAAIRSRNTGSFVDVEAV